MTTKGQQCIQQMEEYTRLGQMYGPLDSSRDRLYSEAQRTIDKMILLSNEAQVLERAGDLDTAVAIYEELVEQQHLHPGPYHRLRIFYAKQRRFKDAIRICQAFIHLEALKMESEKRAGERIHPIYPERVKRFAEWIEKYKAKQEKTIP